MDQHLHVGAWIGELKSDALTVRRDKINSQFIVTKLSILYAGGRSLFRFQTSRES